jgi:hypothetical protein
MKTENDKARKSRPRSAIRNQLNTHKWESKMEIHRLISGKPDLKITKHKKPQD